MDTRFEIALNGPLRTCGYVCGAMVGNCRKVLTARTPNANVRAALTNNVATTAFQLNENVSRSHRIRMTAWRSSVNSGFQIFLRILLRMLANGQHLRQPGGYRACAVPGRLTRRGWPLAAKSPEGFAQMLCWRRSNYQNVSYEVLCVEPLWLRPNQQRLLRVPLEPHCPAAALPRPTGPQIPNCQGKFEYELPLELSGI